MGRRFLSVWERELDKVISYWIWIVTARTEILIGSEEAVNWYLGRKRDRASRFVLKLMVAGEHEDQLIMSTIYDEKGILN